MPGDSVTYIAYPARDTKRFPDGRVEESLGGVMFGALAMATLGRGAGLGVQVVAPLGRDVADEALRLLARGGCRLDATRIVDGETQHSEITLTGDNERWERVSGGLPPLGFGEVEPWLTGHAVGLNFITGSEIDLETLRRVRNRFDGPIVMDYHTLALATEPDGRRVHRRRPDWAAWIANADVLQMNEAEADTLAGRGLVTEDAYAAFARELLHAGPRAVVITRADAGSVGAERTPDGFATYSMDAHRPDRVVDTVGCGDVFHAALTIGWVTERRLLPAMRLANVAAGVHAGYAGLDGISGLHSARRAADAVPADR